MQGKIKKAPAIKITVFLYIFWQVATAVTYTSQKLFFSPV